MIGQRTAAIFDRPDKLNDVLHNFCRRHLCTGDAGRDGYITDIIFYLTLKMLYLRRLQHDIFTSLKRLFTAIMALAGHLGWYFQCRLWRSSINSVKYGSYPLSFKDNSS